MPAADPRQLLRHLELRLPEMLATSRELVEMESPSFSKDAVDRLGKLLAVKFEALGGKTQFHHVKTYGDHLQVDFAGTNSKPVMLLGHHDTVYDLGTLPTMPFRTTRERLYGPGTLDMKCGIVMMMIA